jgi:hypothetical protein
MTLPPRIIALIAVLIGATAGAAELPDDSVIYDPAAPKVERVSPKPIPSHPGPHLLIEDELIASSRSLLRVVNRPTRDPHNSKPIVSGGEDRCFQPYFTVLRDERSQRFRLWYGAWTDDERTDRSRLAYMESADGVQWKRPTRILEQPAEIQFGSEVLDRGELCDPASRYVYGYYLEDGLRVAVSPDGLSFRPLLDRVVLRHDHDIDNISFDELRGRYVATVSSVISSSRFKGKRRTTLQSLSQNLIDWSPPRIVLCADDKLDEGDTQFYAMSGFLTRGPLRIAMVKVLRDDLFCDADELLKQRNGGYGTGYTTLAWTRDGQHWTRDREKFFDRGAAGSWDRSHAWIDEQLIVGDEVYLYYAGYRSGHKANRFQERQIGLLKMPLDRYVSREPADGKNAELLTIPISLNHDVKVLELNVDASAGCVRVQLRDGTTGAVLDGFSMDECRPITSDGLRVGVHWRDSRDISQLRDKSVCLEFSLHRAKLYSFNFP